MAGERSGDQGMRVGGQHAGKATPATMQLGKLKANEMTGKWPCSLPPSKGEEEIQGHL